MSLRDVLIEQIDRNKKNIAAYEKRIKKLPKGSLHIKKRGDKVYFYLKYRDENGKRVDKYIRGEDVDEIRKQIKKRNDYLSTVKQLKEDIDIAQKGLK